MVTYNDAVGIGQQAVSRPTFAHAGCQRQPGVATLSLNNLTPVVGSGAQRRQRQHGRRPRRAAQHQHLPVAVAVGRLHHAAPAPSLDQHRRGQQHRRHPEQLHRHRRPGRADAARAADATPTKAARSSRWARAHSSPVSTGLPGGTTASNGNDTLTGTAGRHAGRRGRRRHHERRAGNDTYIVDHPGDVVVENAGEGTDTINTTVSLHAARQRRDAAPAGQPAHQRHRQCAEQHHCPARSTRPPTCWPAAPATTPTISVRATRRRAARRGHRHCQHLRGLHAARQRGEPGRSTSPAPPRAAPATS